VLRWWSGRGGSVIAPARQLIAIEGRHRAESFLRCLRTSIFVVSTGCDDLARTMRWMRCVSRSILGLAGEHHRLKQVVQGFSAYHGVPGNGRATAAFRFHVSNLWWNVLCTSKPTRQHDVGSDATALQPVAAGKRPETFSFLGFVHYCTRNRKGNFKLGRKTEKSRLRRSIARLTELMREIRHRLGRELLVNTEAVLPCRPLLVQDAVQPDLERRIYVGGL
jgi:hypothetical protein